MLYGTNWVSKPTTIGHVLEVCNSLPAYLEDEDKPSFAYSNISELVKDMCRVNSIRPVEFDIEAMCSAHTKYERRFWEQALDLTLHDAAVWHTFRAAREDLPKDRERQAQIACDLWMWSRQLRKDVAEER